MPKNIKGGRNYKKRGKDISGGEGREITLKEENQEYAKATKELGNSRFQLECFDGKPRLGIIRGKMKKKVWIAEGDIVLVGLREFEDDKCDIIHKYNQDEARLLKKMGHIPDSVDLNYTKITTDNSNGVTDIGFDIENL